MRGNKESERELEEILTALPSVNSAFLQRVKISILLTPGIFQTIVTVYISHQQKHSFFYQLMLFFIFIFIFVQTFMILIHGKSVNWDFIIGKEG